MRTREQVILAALAAERALTWQDVESRAESLPAMILRHGVLPVKLFLLSKKQDSDARLWDLVEKGIHAVLPDVPIGLEKLSELPFETYLLLNEVAAESAALVARWVKAHTPRK
jgi:hypothetical protein